MTLEEISREYDRSADLLCARMRILRRMERRAATEMERKVLYARRMALLPLLRECRHMARQTKNYYKGGRKHGKQ